MGLLKISSSRIHLVIITFTQFENRFGGRIKILIWFEGNTLKCSKTDVPNNNEYMNRGREIKIEPNRPNHTKLLWWYFAWNTILFWHYLVEYSIRVEFGRSLRPFTLDWSVRNCMYLCEKGSIAWK